MKLAFCLFKYFPYGGLQRDFLRIARLCRDRGHEIHVYTMQWEGEVEPGLHLHIIQAKGWQNHTRIRSFTQKLSQIFMTNKHDLVIGFNKMPNLDVYYAADVCYQARVRKERGFFYRLLPRYRQHLLFEKAVFAQNKKTQILLISPLQQKFFSQYYQTEAHRLHLLPPGIAKDRLAKANAAEIRENLRCAYHLSSTDFLLLMVGSSFHTKGLDRSILALASLPASLKTRCHLFVIGQGDPVPFQQLAVKHAVANHLHFLGGRMDVPDFLLAADLLLHPAYHENTGTVILEAMVAGLPVLTVAACGYAHYVEEAEAGMVIAMPFQQQALNVALQTMLLSPQRSLWKQNGLTFAREADIYSLPEKAADIIDTVGKQKLINAEENMLSFSLQKRKEKLFLHPTLQPYLSSHPPVFTQMLALRGECFRQQNGRLTQRIQLGKQTYFIKQHTGVGWKEILKNILQCRLPVISAKNEWLAIEKLTTLKIDVPTVVAYGVRGMNPAKKESFVLMEELTPTISLEDLCKHWQQQPPAFTFKKQLIEKIAHIAQTLHNNGLNHRDFYLCHFLLDLSSAGEQQYSNALKLYLIDLHRVQIRRVTPERWRIKDLAGLYFSSKEMGLTQRDFYRFMRLYQRKSLRDILHSKAKFWHKVRNRGEQLYRDHFA